MATSDLDRLRRWEDMGGTWQLAGRSDTTVTLALCRCDGGEEVDRFTSGEPSLLAYVDQTGDRADPGTA